MMEQVDRRKRSQQAYERSQTNKSQIVSVGNAVIDFEHDNYREADIPRCGSHYEQLCKMW